MIKIGISGSSNASKTHIRQLQESGLFQICGFYSTDIVSARSLIKELNIPYFSDFSALIKVCDAISFTTVTTQFFNHIAQAVKSFKHIYINFPYHLNTNELKNINNLVKEAEVVAQTGFSDRFNPAFLTARPLIQSPNYIDAARLIQYSPQNNRISVIRDLLIKDIEIVLHLIQSNVKKLSANAVSIMHENPDMVSTRIEFDNGSIANLTAGRVSEMNIRKVRVYQNQSYIFIDLYEKWVKSSSKISEQLDFEDIPVNHNNDQPEPLLHFSRAIHNNLTSSAFLETICDVSDIADKISEKIKLHTNIFST